MKQQPFLDEAFDKGLQLAFPPVMVQLLKALLEPEPSFDAIAGYLEMDALLAGKVLHIVNTSSYGFATKFTSLRRAAVAIGTSDLLKLVIALSLQKKLHPGPGRNIAKLYTDWRLTLWSALAAEAIADKLCPKYKGEAYLGGMLKDLPIYLALCSDKAPDFLQGDSPATTYSAAFTAEELGYWGRSHAEIARDILLFWGLPEELCEAVRVHHDQGALAEGGSLDKCLIFATRWAELLHAPHVDPGELVAFELTLAAELGYSEIDLDEFRKNCANRFNALAGQLGIKRGAPEAALYEQSLADLQTCYFLAVGMLREFTSRGAFVMAGNLQHQLRLFWGVNDWRLRLVLPLTGDVLYFRCENKVVRQVSPTKQEQVPPPGWTSLFLTVGQAKYGRLDLCMPEDRVHQSSLPTFVHMLALCLNEYKIHDLSEGRFPTLDALPFVLARVNAEGTIEGATGRFFDTFGVQSAGPGARASELLEKRIGISSASWESLAEAPGRILTIPEGSASGTPVYLSRTPAADAEGDCYLFLGETSGLSEMQRLALGHPGLLEVLLDRADEQIFLLDANGVVLWADASGTDCVGKSVFNCVKPKDIGADAWNPGFLAQVLDAVSLTVPSTQEEDSRTLTLAPLAVSGAKRYLMVVRRAPVAGNGGARPERQSANRDPLTGLYGYSPFHSLLQHFAEIAKKNRIALGIIFCDIYALDSVNNEHGYSAGDALLRRTAEILTFACRKGQDFPCRYGADKFAILVGRATHTLLDSMAARIQQLVKEENDPLLRLYIGLALLEPGQVPKERLDAARSECKKACDMNQPVRWADYVQGSQEPPPVDDSDRRRKSSA